METKPVDIELHRQAVIGTFFLVPNLSANKCGLFCLRVPVKFLHYSITLSLKLWKSTAGRTALAAHSFSDSPNRLGSIHLPVNSSHLTTFFSCSTSARIQLESILSRHPTEIVDHNHNAVHKIRIIRVQEQCENSRTDIDSLLLIHDSHCKM